VDGGVRLSHAAWPLVALSLVAFSGMAWWMMGPSGSGLWGWYAAPQASGAQAWRWWSAAVVHLNVEHLVGNLWAAAVVGAWGWVARVSAPQAIAWLLAWPLSQALLVTDPGSLARYAGLSATLHAGTAIVCWHLLWQAHGLRRGVGAAVSLAISIKLAMEVPVLQQAVAGWMGTGPPQPQALPHAPGHVVAGHAHGCGVLAGVVAAALVDGIIGICRRLRLFRILT